MHTEATPVSEAQEASHEARDAYFLFGIGDTLLGVPAQRVDAVMPWTPATKLPRLPAHFEGLINYEQKALVVANIARFLQLESSPEQPASIVIVRSGELRAGIPVDRALGIANVAPGDLVPPSSLRTGRLPEFVTGQWEHEHGVCGALAVDDFLEAARV